MGHHGHWPGNGGNADCLGLLPTAGWKCFVLTWLVAIFPLSYAFAWWVFFANGAKKVVEYNLMVALGQRGANPPSERLVKVFAAIGVVMFPVWVYGVISMNAPLPS